MMNSEVFLSAATASSRYFSVAWSLTARPPPPPYAVAQSVCSEATTARESQGRDGGASGAAAAGARYGASPSGRRTLGEDTARRRGAAGQTRGPYVGSAAR